MIVTLFNYRETEFFTTGNQRQLATTHHYVQTLHWCMSLLCWPEISTI